MDNLRDSDLIKGDILLVDDAPENLRLLSKILTSQGYTVRKSPSGEMALRAIHSAAPDLILLDVMMPDMDGYEVCRRLKADATVATIPVIFISLLSDAIDKVRAFSSGGADYITKPFQIEEVLARVENQLNIRRLQQQFQALNEFLLQEISERQQAQKALQLEKEKSERLLLNVLPRAIAERLKQTENTIAEQYDDTTILFADIVGFTTLATQLPPIRLVSLLNQVFSKFDELAERHSLEKIKTIGDAYMVAAGLPVPRADHAEAIAEMALDMQAAISEFSWEKGKTLALRIGINSGTVVAGVIGTKKFIYDLWGDTVNIASRMESHGIPNSIQVAPDTYARLKHKYSFTERRVTNVKGKGDMVAYLLKGRLSDEVPIKP